MKPVFYSKIKDQLQGLTRRRKYRLLLTTIEWQEFRAGVIRRDKKHCLMCEKPEGDIFEEMPIEEWEKIANPIIAENNARKKMYQDNPQLQVNMILEGKLPFEPVPAQKWIVGEIRLEVHHDLYFDNKLPWQYDLKYMKTLCSDCHRSFHQNNHVYLYKDDSKLYRKVTKNCPRCGGSGYMPEYDHWYDGVCFECDGLGFDIDNSHNWELNPDV